MRYYLLNKQKLYDLSCYQTYTIGNSQQDDIPLNIDHRLTITVEKGQIKYNNQIYRAGCHQIDHNMMLIILNQQQYFIVQDTTILISQQAFSHICLTDDIACTLTQQSEQSYHIISNQPFFVNGKYYQQETTIKIYDDIFFEAGYSLQIIGKILAIASLKQVTSQYVTIDTLSLPEYRADEFHRSPRFILREPKDKVTIVSPPTEQEQSRQPLLKIIIMPLAMIVFTIMMYFMSANSGMMILMFGMSLITIITSTHSYFSDKKKYKARQIKRVNDYQAYLDSKYQNLAQLSQLQRQSLNYHYPDTSTLIKMSQQVDRRLYEKTPYHFDFLTYQLGAGQVPASFVIDYNTADLTQYNKEVSQQVDRLISHYQTLNDVPIVNEIKSVPIGYIGTRKIVIEQLQQMMMQLAAFHSYHDVQFIIVFREEELPLWQWSRWLPHTQLKAFNSRGFVYNQRTRDQILTSLYQMIKERKLAAQQANNKEPIYQPQYIFLITDMSLLLDHNMMEYINEDLTSLGISYVFVEEVIESLPEHVKTVVDYHSDKKATLLLQNGDYISQALVPLIIINQSKKEAFARAMASITHIQTLRNALPDTVTLLEMYGVNKVEQLQIAQRWQQNEVYQSMAVPLGMRGRNDILYLNLHEKAHGPHGLIAGTTGSGKSELVQSYILSLAINYHPYEIAFLLIDYKGGGMANLFSDLPHLVGTITNLDGHQSERALISIKAELKKRQLLFNQHDVNHINQYTKLFKEGIVATPMPHLFIISDEFAELKAEQPDFMKELVSIARIGRSLGIHLILATQKPNGVVTDQIWSNAKFKIALKVQDETDSKEMIKTADAADITQVGRAYLQVGNNEIYELFQSAWSGAKYSPEGKHKSNRNLTVYEITDSGQYQAINKDLSGLTQQQQISNISTELEVIVQTTKCIFTESGLTKLSSPWLPPLATTVYAQDLQSIDFHHTWSTSSYDIEVLIGQQDMPEQQNQLPLHFNMTETGHILLVSSPGFGKSTFLQSFAIDIMRKHTPQQAHFYLYDFGTSGLMPLSDFPHSADYFTVDEDEKILKSLRIIKEEIKQRKQALSKVRAMNLSQYNQLSQQHFANLFILIDGFEDILDSNYEDNFLELLNLIAREGASLGIYLVVTTSRSNALKMQLLANFKTKLSLFLFDKTDLSNSLGNSTIHLEEIKGRGVIKLENITHFQIALPYQFDTYANYIQQIKDESQQMIANWQGDLPNKIPMLPQIVTQDAINKMTEDIVFKDKFVLGLYQENVEIAMFNLNHSISLISDNMTAIINYYEIIENHLSKWSDFYQGVMIDYKQVIPNKYLKSAYRPTDKQDTITTLRDIIEDIHQRTIHPQAYMNCLVIIPDIESLPYDLGITETEFRQLIIEGPKHGIIPIFVGQHKDIIRAYHDFVTIHKQNAKQVFLSMRITDQEYVSFPYIANEKQVKPYQGYIMTQEKYEFVQLIDKGE